MKTNEIYLGDARELLKQMLYKLDLMLGENHAGEVICILADSLNKMLKEKTHKKKGE